MKVIINADDFGINEVVTNEIEKLIEEGKISSTTIMANGECLQEVSRFAKLHPEISFGVHLCLSEFRSITNSPILKKYGLLDDKGNFIRRAIFSINFFPDELKEAIANELNEQIIVVRNLGIPLSHCDSHHHVHTVFDLKEVFADVLKSNGFNKIRIATNYTSFRMKFHPSMLLKRYKLNKFYSHRFITTDKFCSLSDYKLFSEKFNFNIIELMCHPGHVNNKYVSEISLLRSDEFQATLPSLVSYKELV